LTEFLACGTEFWVIAPQAIKKTRLKTRSNHGAVVCTGSNSVGKANNEAQLI